MLLLLIIKLFLLLIYTMIVAYFLASYSERKKIISFQTITQKTLFKQTKQIKKTKKTRKTFSNINTQTISINT